MFHRHEWEELGEVWVIRGDPIGRAYNEAGIGVHHIGCEVRRCKSCNQHEQRIPIRVQQNMGLHRDWVECSLWNDQLAEGKIGNIPKSWKSIKIDVTKIDVK